MQGMVIESDGAVSQKDREVREAEISELMLEAERREIACIWHAEERGEIIDFRASKLPQSLLGVRLVVRPHAPSGSSPEHAAYSVIGR
jgi:hypothetical protein